MKSPTTTITSIMCLVVLLVFLIIVGCGHYFTKRDGCWSNTCLKQRWKSGKTIIILKKGTLMVRGNGAMEDYGLCRPDREDWAPWYASWCGFFGPTLCKFEITNVVIMGNVTHIGKFAFCGLSGLRSVTIAESVVSIWAGAFFNCDSLVSINVATDNAHYSSEGGVLFNKTKDTLILYPHGKQGAYVIPNGVTTIGATAFYGSIGLTSVTIPNSMTPGLACVKEFNSYSDQTSLASIIETNTKSGLLSRVFGNCTGLTSITVAEDNAYYASEGGVLFNKTKDTLILYPRGRQGAYTIPGNVMSIGAWAFSGSIGLTSITIENSVELIGEYAFSGCTGLLSITSLNPVPPNILSITVPPDINRNAFAKLPMDICLYVPEGSIDAYRTAEGWNEFKCIKDLESAPKGE